MRTWRSGAAALALILSTGGLSAYADETVTTTEDISLGGATPWIMVQTAGGGISVTPSGDGNVHVEAKRTAPTTDEAKALKVIAKLDRGVVRILWASDGKPHHSVSFVISAPPPCRVALNTKGGGIDVDGITGGVTANTSGGGINAHNLKNEISLKTSGGGIHADAIEGTIDARTSGGGVGVSGTLRGANVVATSGGSVEVKLSDKSKLKVEGSSGGGSAANDFGWPVENQHFKGTIGDGSSGSLNAHTTGGSVAVKKL
jgi:hypothetical protein